MNVDIFAPGRDIYTTNPISEEYPTGYFYWSGTSYATPFVTGVAALLLSRNPTLTPESIKSSIIDNCDKVSELNGLCGSGGRLNAYKAVSAVPKHEHVYQYRSIDSNTHEMYCECGHSTTAAHSIFQHNCKYCEYFESHYFTAPYTWLNYTNHKAKCKCGEYTTQPHAIVKDPILNSLPTYYTCIRCGGKAKWGFEKLGWTNVQLVTENGSYVLPNGVIVLDNRDIEAYLRDELVFYKNNAM